MLFELEALLQVSKLEIDSKNIQISKFENLLAAPMSNTTVSFCEDETLDDMKTKMDVLLQENKNFR
jgi:hypothetical protein